MNSRITKKERALIKGKINSIFSRSEWRRKVLYKALVPHKDPNRPRVKRWCRCAGCGLPDAISYMDVDHIKPKVPVDRPFEDMGFDEYIDLVWCPESNLQVLCQLCHTKKSSGEASMRAAAKRKAKKRGKPTKKNKLSKRNTRR